MDEKTVCIVHNSIDHNSTSVTITRRLVRQKVYKPTYSSLQRLEQYVRFNQPFIHPHFSTWGLGLYFVVKKEK